MLRMKQLNRKHILVVGDKVLLLPDNDRERTEHGLYLPPSDREKEKVQSGFVVKVGPGFPVANPHFIEDEPWSTTPRDPVKYIPLQVEEGDYAIFLKDQAIEIEYDSKKYLIIQQSAILMVIRNDIMEGLES